MCQDKRFVNAANACAVIDSSVMVLRLWCGNDTAWGGIIWRISGCPLSELYNLMVYFIPLLIRPVLITISDCKFPCHTLYSMHSLLTVVFVQHMVLSGCLKDSLSFAHTPFHITAWVAMANCNCTIAANQPRIQRKRIHSVSNVCATLTTI